ncbi:MAG: zinc ribbon domain-containing protein, partial [Anaerolineales bacterium]|nr:zinc ribbon domain-containing protein [Anaerolineales bacterium]
MVIELPFPIQPPLQWTGELPVTSRYTYGIALEKFFLALKEEGKILGSCCSKCSKIYVPTTYFCPQCLAELNETTDVGLDGEIHSYTLLY